MPATPLEQVGQAERQVAAFDARIEADVGERSRAVTTPVGREAVARLDAIPGFDKRAARNALAEIRTGALPHRRPLGVPGPGDNESAGKRRAGRVYGSVLVWYRRPTPAQ